MENKEKGRFERLYNKHYKHLLLIPIILLLLSLTYLFVLYSNTGDFFHKDFSLTGGTSVTIIGDIDAETLETELSGVLDNLNTREIYDITTREQTALIVETSSEISQARDAIESHLGYSLNEDNSSIEFISPTLGESFYRQIASAILIAFLFMSMVVFFIFRKVVPSVAIIISAFANIVFTLTLIGILGIQMSAAGIVAFLMIIGYSVDTDILLTNRMLKRTEGSLNHRIFGAFKTGITMTLTSIFAIFLALMVSMSFSELLTQIFTVLVIGLTFDLINTWVTNVSLLKWYMERKHG